MKLFIGICFLTLFSPIFCLNKSLARASWKPIYDHCDSYIRVFAEAAANFSECAIENAFPPKVCLSCADYYTHFSAAFDRLKDDKYKLPETGETCAHTIFKNYELSTINAVFDDLKSDIWEASRCDFCIVFLISPSKEHTHAYDYSVNAKRFLEIYQNFTNCTDSYKAESVEKSNSTVCDFCWEYYEKVNEYYDKVFFHKSTEFCYDLQAMMNDTVRWWRDQQSCVKPEYPRKSKDVLVVAILCGLVFGSCFVFYLLSFLIGTRRKRTLKKYQRAGTNQSFAVINASREHARTPRVEHSALLQEAARPRRVISYSILPPSSLG